MTETDKISAVIPYLYTADNYGLELRYMLRSLHRHCSGIGNIVLVCDRPPNWLTGVDVIRYEKIDNSCYRERNIRDRVVAAIRSGAVTPTFLYTNDDFFITEDVVATAFPLYHKGGIRDTAMQIYRNNRTNPYRLTLLNTERAFRHLRPDIAGTDVINFDCHCPVTMTTTGFMAAASDPNWNRRHCIGIKTGYVYTTGFDPLQIRYLPDMKLNPGHFGADFTAAEAVSVLQRLPWFSTGDEIIKNPIFVQALNTLYAEPSPYEAG